MAADDRRAAFRARARAMSMSMTLANFTYGNDEFMTSREIAEYVHPKLRVNIPDFGPIDADPLMAGDSDDYFFLNDDEYNAVWPIDVSFAMPVSADPRGFILTRVRTVAPREVRGLAQRISSRMVMVKNAYFVNGRWSDGSALLSYLGRRWVDACPRGISWASFGQRPQHFVSETDFIVGVAIGHALRQRYDWQAIFEFPNHISVRFGTSADAALAIFRDRDKPAELQRRNPLLHWVRRHWRRGRTTPELLREVRKHLRGKSTFRWHDMDVTILPSEYELETAA